MSRRDIVELLELLLGVIVFLGLALWVGIILRMHA